MKTIKNLIVLIITALSVISCEKEQYEYYNLATPILMSAEEFRTSIKILPPREILESGKIYAYKNYIFVNDKNKGVHVIDNSNPANPIKRSYINIPGNIDISVKNEILYANSFVDLVVFDISNIEQMKIINRLKNIFPYNYAIPEGADAINWEKVNANGGFVVDWVITKEKRLIEDETNIFWTTDASISNSVGKGGSMARFKIVDKFLYVVDSHSIHIFDIGNLENPFKLESIYAGFDIETIFNKNNFLFLGSKSGMFIYDITNPSTPNFVSEFQHGTACDPVVVDEQYAYITLRAGNLCGAFESSLEIVDITDIENPVLETSYTMDNPYGLGVKDNKLFICDGASGLKVYDKSNVNNLELLNHFKDINAFDVIPLESHLLVIGEGVLYQFRYESDTLTLVSTFNLN